MQEVERLLHLILLHLLAASFWKVSLDLTYILGRSASLARHLGPRSLDHYIATLILVPQRVNGVHLRFIDILNVHWGLIAEFHRFNDGRLFTHGGLWPLESSSYLFFLDFWLLSGKVGLGEIWRQNFKLSCLGFLEGLRTNGESLLHVRGDLSRSHLFLFW